MKISTPPFINRGVQTCTCAVHDLATAARHLQRLPEPCSQFCRLVWRDNCEQPKDLYASEQSSGSEEDTTAVPLLERMRSVTFTHAERLIPMY